MTPSGWRSSAPAPAPIAIGSEPSSAQVVVIMIGRKRSSAASTIASSADGALGAPLEREVDHHDGVLLDDADQHDDADHGDDAEIHAEQLSVSSAPMPADGRPDRMVSGWMKFS